MYHSITFGTKNTWDDWHLIPKSRPLFNPPSVKTNYVEIPGGDGVLDLTTALSGRPLYKNRTGSFEFYVENGFRSWYYLHSEIMAYLHGQKIRAILEDDSAYYYEGRFSVNAWKSEKDRSTIVIDYDVSPYKREVFGTADEWLWDTFNFETGVIRYYRNLPVSGSLSVTVIGGTMPVCPVIITSVNGMTVTFAGTSYDLSKGTNIISELILQNGENVLTFRGSGRITVEYNGGIL